MKDNRLIDVDAKILAHDPDILTAFAVVLEARMLCDDEARARYAQIYGREWVPLSEQS